MALRALDLGELLDLGRPVQAAPPTDDFLADPRPGLLRDAEFPGGLSKAPFTWVQRDAAGELLHRWEMELIAGFAGVAQDPETLTLRPEIGWAVREQAGGLRHG